jgi:fructokinase
MKPRWGGVEAGGTKFVCILAHEYKNILAKARIPTTTPQETLIQVQRFFENNHKGALAGIGVASFGPLDLDPKSDTFGFITTTPKKGWANTDIINPFTETFHVPVVLDTDVNGAAFGEYLWGAAQGLQNFIYLTIGTGIGGGGMVNGQRMHGLTHPEMGHIRIPHNWDQDPFPGSCPFHGDCLEGLASGSAMQTRWGISPKELPSDHPAWELETHYLALGLVNFITTISPERIVIGGGIMQHPTLIDTTRKKVQELLGGYIHHTALIENIDNYIVPPGLGNLAGAYGAMGLAMKNQTH